MSIQAELKSYIARLLSKATELDVLEVERLLEKPKKTDFGDFSFPCFSLAKSSKLPPQECAKSLAEKLLFSEDIEKCTPTGPFLNFQLNKNRLISRVLSNLASKDTCPKKIDKTAVIEYSSPNIAKPFHVGHLRATLIGHCLDKVYRRLGWNTISINHLGDWGTQFGFVWAGCQIWGAPEKKTVSSLVDLYRKATELKEKQAGSEEMDLPDVNSMARSYFIDLENKEESAVSFWRECVDVSLSYFKQSYKRLDIDFDHYIGESFYADKLSGVKTELEASGLLKASQGALGIELEEELGFARIFTPDGRSLYLTRDLAAADYRAKTFAFDKAIYVVGAPQTLHFQQLKAVLKALKRKYAANIVHVAFGHVMGMKTRGQGGFIELNDFLDEAQSRALDAYHTQVGKRPPGLDEDEVAKGVALSAIIFSNISRSNIKDVHFSWDTALAFQGDTGPYLLYACARINGIRERVSLSTDVSSAPPDSTLLTEDSAYRLALLLDEFEVVLEKTAEDNEPSHLASYALSLAKSFSKAYLDLKILEQPMELAKARLHLFEEVQKIMSECLQLLGIPPLERM